jgi:hypothetical protein
MKDDDCGSFDSFSKEPACSARTLPMIGSSKREDWAVCTERYG